MNTKKTTKRQTSDESVSARIDRALAEVDRLKALLAPKPAKR